MARTKTDKLTPMETLRRIILNQQYEKIHGVLVDAFTAGAMLIVYDTIGIENKAKFERMINSGPVGLRKVAAFSMEKMVGV